MLDSYVDVKQDDSIEDICSPGSYGLKHCTLQLDRAALVASLSKMKKSNGFGNLINV